MTTTSMVMIGFVVVALVIGVGILWNSWRSGRAFRTPMPRPYRGRQSQEDAWRQRHGGDAIEHADAVLKIVCDAFTFNPDSRYQLAPDDRIMDIYRRLYPPRRFWALGDSMEIETLGIVLDREYGSRVSKLHKDITIAEIVDNIVQVAGSPGRSAT